jgi:subtilisin family serine protease
MSARSFTLLAALLAGAPSPEDAGGDRELLVRFKPGVEEPRRRAAIASAGAEFGKISRSRRREPLHLLRVPAPADPDAVRARLASHPDVAAVQPNFRYRSAETIPDDPRFPDLWALRNTGQSGGTPGADIGAALAWDLTTGDPGVVIAVLDTGMRATHQDLAANRWVNPGEIPGDEVDNDGNGYVDDVHGWDFLDEDDDPYDGVGHGTHMAGILGARGNNLKGVTGVCWNVKILALRYLGLNGGSDFDAIQALDYAVDLKVNRGINLVAINCSWTSPAYSQALYDAMKDAQDAGILLVCAAGNEGTNTDLAPVYPASFDLPGILSVGASDRNDRPADLSCFGPRSVDLFAPGVDILSTYEPRDNVYSWKTGTSMAAAHVSGALGLLAALRPGESAARRRDRLLHNVDRKDALAGRALSYGRLNVFRALQDDEAVPPDATTTLAASDPSFSAATLSWTAPGDDGAVGRAATYDVRFSTSPIDASNFDSATRFPCPPLPLDAGGPQSMRVGGLPSSTNCYFALKTIDTLGNTSAISNVATAATLPGSSAQVFHADDFEGTGPLDPARWVAPAPWGRLDLLGSIRAADSPSGPYAGSLDLALTSAVFNLSGKRDAVLSFSQRHSFETGADFGFVEVSRDAGATWEWITQASGSWPAFASTGRIPLPSLDGAATARLRFRLKSNAGGGQDGWALDDVLVQADSGGTNGHPAAQPQEVATLPDTAVAITLAGTDPEGSPLSFTLGAGPSNGTLSGTAPALTYTPAPGFVGPDAFTFTVSDGTDTSAPAEVSITAAAPPPPPPPGGSGSGGGACGLAGLEAVAILGLASFLRRPRRSVSACIPHVFRLR